MAAYARRLMEHRLPRTIERLPGWLQRLVEIGALPSDPDELRVRKSVLVLSSVLMASIAFVWVVTYALARALGCRRRSRSSTRSPSAASIATFARTRRYILFRTSQLVLTPRVPVRAAVEPRRLRELLGRRPLGDHLAARRARSSSARASPSRGSLAFAGLVAVSAAIDPTLAANAPDVPQGVVVAFFALNILGVATTVFALLQYFVRARERALRTSRASTRRSSASRTSPSACCSTSSRRPSRRASRSDEERHRRRLPRGHRPVRRPRRVHAALASGSPPRELVSLLDGVFARWDALAAAHGVEKIKTIGDAYMVAGGHPAPAGRPRRGDRRGGARDGPGAGGAARRETGVPLAGADRHRQRARSSPASSAGRSSATTSGATPSTPRAGWSRTASPGTIQVTERAYERLREPVRCCASAGRSTSRARAR